MSSKIFISYRREDSGANALGISQYLERELGRKNVFIDVDMRAGAKFPVVLEERLGECKVMLVLIGPGWLNATDGQGHRRLDNPHDWVRLEIAHALRRNITVIPVRVNGTALPASTDLPDDIRSLLDHQAVSISLAGFRHEMASLVRDIRAIPAGRSWLGSRTKKLAAAAAVVLCLAILSQAREIDTAVERLWPAGAVTASRTDRNELWKSRPGEWVAYAIDNRPAAFFVKPNSIRTAGDRVIFATRVPALVGNSASASQNAYEDDINVMDCATSQWALAEKAVYDKPGKLAYQFKWGEPETLDLSIGADIVDGSINAIAKKMMCDGKIRSRLISDKQLPNLPYSHLSSTANGDGEILYNELKSNSSDGRTEITAMIRYNEDQRFAAKFPGHNITGMPETFRSVLQPLELSCSERKMQSSDVEYFDMNGYLQFFALSASEQVDVKVNPFLSLLNIGCGSEVTGTYEGMNSANYEKVGSGEQKISIVVTQDGAKVNVSFKTASGGEGKGTGTLTGSTVTSITIKNTAPGCPGSYQGSLEFKGDTITWTYRGKDCTGPVEGHGTATRVKA